jgi:ribosome-associated protein
MPESRESTEDGRVAQDGAAETDAATDAGGGSAAAPAELDERLRLALHEVASFTDYFVIASGTNVRQVQAVADEVQEQLRKRLGVKPARVEGYNSAEWVLLDYGDFIFHVFEEKSRRFYDLERLWRDAARVPLPPDEGGGSLRDAG